jgi:adenine-specific DNA-methyltransferase
VYLLNKKFEEMTKEELIEQIKKLKSLKKYGLIWEDHPEDVDNNSFPMLEEVKNREINFFGEQHLLLEGDNYHSLRSLLYTHKGVIDVIYIDPPYNTGSGEFVYNDKMIDSEDEYKHSKWLSFMEKRLKIARELMSEEGVIFISIDNNEQAQLKLLCDHIFGEKNFYTSFSWINSITEELSESTKFAGSNLGEFKNSYEYILTYTKKNFKMKLDSSNEPYIKKLITNGGNNINKLVVPKGLKCTSPITNVFLGKIGGKQDYFNILNIEGMIIKNGVLQNSIIIEGPLRNHKMLERFFNGETVIDNKKQKLLEVYIAPNGMIHTKKERMGDTPSNVLVGKGTTKNGTMLLKEMFGESVFNYSKPVSLIKYLISKHTNENSIVLDFFAGSGTTGHSVLELNKEDGGKRKFILCTNNEVSKDKEICKLIEMGFISVQPDFKKGNEFKEWLKEYQTLKESDIYKNFLKSDDYQELGIARKVTYERIKKVINGYTTPKREKIEGIPGTLKYYKTIDVGNIEKPSRKNIKEVISYLESLLHIKHSTFSKIIDTDYYSIYENKDEITAYLKDIFFLTDFKTEINKLGNKKIIFYFINEDPDSLKDIITDLQNTYKNAEFHNVPDEIQTFFRRNLKKYSKKRGE